MIDKKEEIFVDSQRFEPLAYYWYNKYGFTDYVHIANEKKLYKKLIKNIKIIDNFNGSIYQTSSKFHVLGMQIAEFKNIKIAISQFFDNRFHIYFDADNAELLAEFLNKNKKASKKEPIYIHILKKGTYGLETFKKTIKSFNLDFDNYNTDLRKAHKELCTKLKEKNESGLYLLHGAPGTGKTTYIRSLIKAMPKKKFIYVPKYIVEQMADPSAIEFIVSQEDSIFIIEDAEDIIQQSQTRTNGVSNLLNFSDGLLGDIANINFILTFNTQLSNIDKALLRKGRLKYKYEFCELEDEVRDKLCKKLNLEYCKSNILADIYNSQDNNLNKSVKKKIGF